MIWKSFQYFSDLKVNQVIFDIKNRLNNFPSEKNLFMFSQMQIIKLCTCTGWSNENLFSPLLFETGKICTNDSWKDLQIFFNASIRKMMNFCFFWTPCTFLCRWKHRQMVFQKMYYTWYVLGFYDFDKILLRYCEVLRII